MAGGLAARLDLLKKNLVLSNMAAATGVCFPIGLSYLLLYLGYGYGAVETFIIGAALSATSLGMIASPDILGQTLTESQARRSLSFHRRPRQLILDRLEWAQCS